MMVAGVAAVHRFENIRKTFLRELLPRNLLLTLAAIASTVLNFPQSFHRAYRLVDAEQTFPSRSSNRSSPIVTVDYSSFSFLPVSDLAKSRTRIFYYPPFPSSLCFWTDIFGEFGIIWKILFSENRTSRF